MDIIIRRVKKNDLSLTIINLSDNIESFEEYTKLMNALITNDKVRSLDISDNELGDKMIDSLINLIIENKTLTSLK
jgi:Ran GTPase-activating protein (RanGAP) involved in mRNA processing and transport